MHLVEVLIEPIKEAVDAIPLPVTIFVFRVAFHDELQLLFVELRPWDMGADLVFLGCALEVA